MHTFDCESLDVALSFFDNKKITTGVYHSREFLWKSVLNYRCQQLDYYSSFPLENVFSTRESILKNLKSTFNGSVRNSTVFELSVNYKKINLTKKKQVVVAARLVGFKSYIEHVLKFWTECDTNSYELIIIGNGPLKGYFKKNYFGPNIVFIDEVHYDDLCRILSESEIFIGSGTSLILAALYKCLPIIGVENDKVGLTPGTLIECNELTFFVNDNNEYFDINLYLKKIFNYSSIEKKSLIEQNYLICKKYDPDISAKKFLNFISGAKKVSIKRVISTAPALKMLILDFLGLNKDFRKRYDN